MEGRRKGVVERQEGEVGDCECWMLDVCWLKDERRRDETGREDSRESRVFQISATVELSDFHWDFCSAGLMGHLPL